MTMKELSRDGILSALGLRVRPSGTSILLGAAGFLAIGLLVGAGVGLLTAPRPGRELREDLRQRLGRVRRESAEEIERRIS